MGGFSERRAHWSLDVEDTRRLHARPPPPTPLDLPQLGPASAVRDGVARCRGRASGGACTRARALGVFFDLSDFDVPTPIALCTPVCSSARNFISRLIRPASVPWVIAPAFFSRVVKVYLCLDGLSCVRKRAEFCVELLGNYVVRIFCQPRGGLDLVGKLFVEGILVPKCVPVIHGYFLNLK